MPRPFPDRLVWARSERWPEPGAFWAEPVEAAELVDLELKYSTLLGLIAMPTGLDRDLGLRGLAARWPGALREGQLATREGLERRRRSLDRAPGTPREAWRAAEIAAVPLWAELHRLSADVARIRAHRVGPETVAAGLGPDGRTRWPTDAAWWSALAWPLDARVGRSWLAAIADVDPATLDRLLRE